MIRSLENMTEKEMLEEKIILSEEDDVAGAGVGFDNCIQIQKRLLNRRN